MGSPGVRVSELALMRPTGFRVRKADRGEQTDCSAEHLREHLGVRRMDDYMVIVEPNSLAPALIKHIENSLAEASAYLVEGDVPPTGDARRAVQSHLWSVASCWSALPELPRPDVTTVGDGEISCEWERGDRSLTLVVYPDGSIFSLRGRMVGGTMVDRRALSAPKYTDTIAALEWVLLGPD